MRQDSRCLVAEKALEWAVLFFIQSSDRECPLDWFEKAHLDKCDFDGKQCSGSPVRCWKRYFLRAARENMAECRKPVPAHKNAAFLYPVREETCNSSDS